MKKKAIITTLSIGLLLLIIYGAYNLIIQGVKQLKEGPEISNSVSSEYISLFTQESRNHFKNNFSYLNKNRAPVSNLDYDSTYSITIFKISLVDKISVNKMIKEEKGDAKSSTNQWYWEDNQTRDKILYKSGTILPVSEIFLTSNLSEAKTIQKNDSIAYYYLKNGEFSIKYGKDSTVDICTESTGAFLISNRLPHSLLFIRRNNNLFILLMSVKNEKAKFDEDFLNTLIANAG